MQKQKPILQKQFFWDVNFDKIDYEKDFQFVIERVFERGDVEDIRQVRRFYGDKKIIKVLKQAKYLPERRIHLIAALFNLELSSLRCYTLMPSLKGLWPY